MPSRINTLFLRLAAVICAYGAIGQGTARAVLLSDIIAGNQTIQSGRLTFSNFAVTVVNTVPTNLIDITPTVDASGNFGLLFTTTGIVSNGGGEIVADVTFTATAWRRRQDQRHSPGHGVHAERRHRGLRYHEFRPLGLAGHSHPLLQR
jgi:hypothetical protein